MRCLSSLEAPRGSLEERRALAWLGALLARLLQATERPSLMVSMAARIVSAEGSAWAITEAPDAPIAAPFMAAKVRAAGSMY